jgi:hypothetical protein
LQVLIAVFLEPGQGIIVKEISEIGIGMLFNVIFRKGYGLGVVSVVEADPHAVVGWITFNLHEPDSRRVKYPLYILADPVNFTLFGHFSPPFKQLKINNATARLCFTEKKKENSS